MKDPNYFWIVFKADMLFAACTTTLTIIGTICLALYRKKKARLAKAAAELFKSKPKPPGHCPLCGRDWPLPGPLPSEKTYAVILEKTEEKKPE
jgi:hypothetical protein